MKAAVAESRVGRSTVPVARKASVTGVNSRWVRISSSGRRSVCRPVSDSHSTMDLQSDVTVPGDAPQIAISMFAAMILVRRLGAAPGSTGSGTQGCQEFFVGLAEDHGHCSEGAGLGAQG